MNVFPSQQHSLPHAAAFPQSCCSPAGRCGCSEVSPSQTGCCRADAGLRMHRFNFPRYCRIACPDSCQPAFPLAVGGRFLHLSAGGDAAPIAASPVIEKRAVAVLFCVSAVIIRVTAPPLSCATCGHRCERCQYILRPSRFGLQLIPFSTNNNNNNKPCTADLQPAQTCHLPH